MTKTAQRSNAASSPAMSPAQAEFISPAHAEPLEQFQTVRKIKAKIPIQLTSCGGRVCKEAKPFCSI